MGEQEAQAHTQISQEQTPFGIMPSPTLLR